MEISKGEHIIICTFGDKPKCCKPNTGDAEVRANNIVSLYDKYLSKRSSFCPYSHLIKSVTVRTFQIKQYLGCEGLLLKAPATKKANSEVFPTDLP